MVRDWTSQLKAILWGLFWLPNLWAAADYHLIELNGLDIDLLILTVLIQVLPLKQRWMNGVLQLLATVALLLGFHSIGWIVSGKWMLLWLQVVRTVLLLSFYFTTLHWITTRTRLLLFFLSTVVVYGLLDSFSSKVIWDKAALIIFTGLCLLILHQLEGIRTKRPNVWSYFAEYPGSLGAPVAILLCMTMVFGLLAPNVPSVIPTGGSGRSATGTASHQQSGSDDSSLNTTSGYSRDDTKLGGGFQYDYSQVIQIDTTQASYLRGETRSYYTGQGWEKSKTEQAAPVFTVGADLPLSVDTQFDSSRLQTVAVTQTITMLNQTKYPVLFGAYSIARVQPVRSDSPLNFSALHWSALQAELRFNGQSNEPFPTSYTVISKVPIVDEAALRSVQKLPDPVLMQDELQLPADLPTRVKQLAETITQNQLTYYDKVKSIEQYLTMNYTYNNTPGAAAPGEDFVDHFLFVSKQGYCDHFSTAMVILTRSLGIPARWVKGYRAGTNQETDQEQLMNDPNPHSVSEGPGVYTILNSDAHSWVEVYFPGFGWIPFEPTGGFSLPKIVPDSQTMSLPAAAAQTAQAAQKKSVHLEIQPLYMAVILLVIALVVLTLLSRSSLLFRFRYGMEKRKAVNRKQKVMLEYRKLVHYLRRQGLQHFPHETIRETFDRWAEQRISVQQDLHTLLAIFEKAKYDKADISSDELSKAMELVKRVCNNRSGLGRK